MEPIIYVAIALDIIFVSAFIWNLLSFAKFAIFGNRPERKDDFNQPRKSRRSMLNSTDKKVEKVKQSQPQIVEKVYTA